MFMKATLIIAALSANPVEAFTPRNRIGVALEQSVSKTSAAPMTTLHAYPSNEHVVKNGGGIPVVPAGDRLLFDPSEQGMLGDTPDVLDQRIGLGSSYHYVQPEYLPAIGGGGLQTSVSPVSPAGIASPVEPNAGTKTAVGTQEAQAWLENIGVPAAFAKASAPVTATVLGRAKLIDDDAPGDIEHVILKLPEGMHYVEGQSLSVIPPGVDPKTGKAHKPRLYSIASTRYGDLLDGNTVSLCVRKAEYTDPTSGQVDPAKEGVCSSFLCRATPGTTVKVAGPVGKTMLLPEDPTKDVIMVATGTGIAPFRAFLHRLFMEHTIARHQFQGKAWLILGVPTTGGLLYPQEFAAMLQQQGPLQEQLQVTYAISREMRNQQGGKLYVQDVLSEQADVVLERLENGAHIYFCGLKGMMPGILESLEQAAAVRGLDWAALLKRYQSNKQWHVEVY